MSPMPPASTWAACTAVGSRFRVSVSIGRCGRPKAVPCPFGGFSGRPAGARRSTRDSRYAEYRFTVSCGDLTDWPMWRATSRTRPTAVFWKDGPRMPSHGRHNSRHRNRAAFGLSSKTESGARRRSSVGNASRCCSVPSAPSTLLASPGTSGETTSPMVVMMSKPRDEGGGTWPLEQRHDATEAMSACLKMADATLSRMLCSNSPTSASKCACPGCISL